MIYKRKPVEIEAFQWFGWIDHPCGKGGVDEWGVVRRLPFFTMLRIGMALGCFPKTKGHSPQRLGWIEDVDGGHIVLPFDYIVRGTKGEFYPLNPDTFLETYEKKTECHNATQ